MGIRSRRGRLVMVTFCTLSIHAFAGERLFFVPKGDDPNQFATGRTQISASAGDRVCLEIYLTSAPENVRGAQPVIPGAGIGGVTGALAIDCSTVMIDEFHPAFPPGPGDVISAVRTVECPAEFAAYIVTPLGSVGPLTIPPGGAYLGEACYDLTGTASGTFAVDFVTAPGSFPTKLLDPNLIDITGFAADGADITVVPPAACCFSNGTCDLLSTLGCVSAGGTVTGAALCGVGSCLGACCDASGCNDLSRDQCAVNQGTFFGLGTTCPNIICECQVNADCDDGDPCTTDVCRDRTCVSCTRHASDVNADCVVNLFDLFCVLKGFNDDFACDQACP